MQGFATRFGLVMLCVASVAVVAASASAHKGHRANSYLALLVSTGVTPTAGPSGPLGSVKPSGLATGNQGRTYLKINLYLTGLNPGVAYPAHVHRDKNGRNCDSKKNPIVLRLGKLVGDSDGNGRIKYRKRHARSSAGLSRNALYYIEAHNPAGGRAISCGSLVPKYPPKRAKKTA